MEIVTSPCSMLCLKLSLYIQFETVNSGKAFPGSSNRKLKQNNFVLGFVSWPLKLNWKSNPHISFILCHLHSSIHTINHMILIKVFLKHWLRATINPNGRSGIDCAPTFFIWLFFHKKGSGIPKFRDLFQFIIFQKNSENLKKCFMTLFWDDLGGAGPLIPPTQSASRSPTLIEIILAPKYPLFGEIGTSLEICSVF